MSCPEPIELPEAKRSDASRTHAISETGKRDWSQPRLVFTIDAEEDFDWRYFSRYNLLVDSIAHQHRAQEIYQKHGIRPVYLVDYPVANELLSVSVLREFVADDICDIGTQLHPWVTPPHEEEVSNRNSYLANLPLDLAEAKISALTRKIEDNFNVQPRTFRAGRYSMNNEIAGILRQQGYDIDLSVLPYTDARRSGGPDFRQFSHEPFWYQDPPSEGLLAIPVTAGMTGLLAGPGRYFYPMLKGRLFESFSIAGILSRLKVLTRITLSPETSTLKEAKSLTRQLFKRGTRLFLVNYHSPSLMPGNTPYAQSEADVERILAWIEEYICFFFEELKGCPGDLSEEYERLQGSEVDKASTG